MCPDCGCEYKSPFTISIQHRKKKGESEDYVWLLDGNEGLQCPNCGLLMHMDAWMDVDWCQMNGLDYRDQIIEWYYCREEAEKNRIIYILEGKHMENKK